MTARAAAAAPPAGRGTAGDREFIILVIAMMASGALAIDTILPAFADVRAEFGMPAGSSRVGWLVTAFFLGLAIGPWLYGPASDRFGRRRPLQAGMVLYIGAGAPRSRRRGRSSWPRGSCGASEPAHRAR